MTKTAIVSGGILLGLFALALIGPGFVDWNRFKGPIERQLSAATGRAVSIDGGIGFSVLPRPAFSLRDLQLANAAEASAPVMLAVARLDAQLSLPALLSGVVQLASFRLTAPVLYLEIMRDGQHNWRFEDLAGSAFALPFEDTQIIDGALNYRNARTGAQYQLDNIDARLIAISRQGPFNVTGALQSRGVPLELAAEVGMIGAPGAVPLTVSVDAIAATGAKAAQLKFSGQLAPPGSDAWLSGTMYWRGADFAQAMRLGAQIFASSVALPAGMAKPFMFEGALELSGGGLLMKNAQLEIAGSTLIASANIKFPPAPVFDAELSAATIDVDTLLAGIAPASLMPSAFDIPAAPSGALRLNFAALRINGGQVRDVKLALSLAGGVASVHELSAKLPGNSRAQIDGALASPGGKPRFTGNAVMQSENLRDLLGWAGVDVSLAPPDRLSRMQARAQIDLNAESAQAHAIDATLDASALRGEISIGLLERPAYDLDLRIDQLNADPYLKLLARPFSAGPALAWLAGVDSKFRLTLDALSYSGIAASGFTADGELRDGALRLNTVSVANVADTAFALSGAVSGLGPGPRGEINLQAASKNASGLARVLKLPLPPGANPGALMARAKLRFNGERLTTGVDGRLGETVVKFNAETAGVVRAALTASPGIGSLHAVLELGNQSFAAFADQFNLPNLTSLYPVDAAADAPIALRAELTGDVAAFVASARLDIAGASVEMAGDLSNAITSRDFKLNATANGAQLTPMLRGLGVDFTPAHPALGGVAVSAALNGNRNSVTLSELDGAIGPVRLRGEGQLRLDAAKPLFHVKLFAGDMLLDQLLAPPVAPAIQSAGQLPWSGEPLDIALLDRFDAKIELQSPHLVWRGIDLTGLKLSASVRDGHAQLHELTGKLFGGPLRLTASLNAAAPAPEFAANLSLGDADIAAASTALRGKALLSGRFNLSGEVSGAGASTFALVSNLAGEVKFTTSGGAIQGVDLPGLSKQLEQVQEVADMLALVKNSFNGGTTPTGIIALPFSISHGVARSARAILDFGTVTGNLSVNIDLPRYWLDAQSKLALKQHGLAPGIDISFTGPVNNPQRRLQTEALESYFTRQLVSKELQRLLEASKQPPAAQTAPPQKPNEATP